MASPPSKLTLALDRAISAYRAGRLGEAEEICQKVVAAKRNFFDGLHVLAVVQAAAGKYDLALANYNRAISLQPKHAEALNNRGNALQELKRFEEALVSYDRALAAKPNFAAALNNRGVTLRLLKQLEPALASLDRALVLEPCYAEALYNRASVLHDMRRLDEALASYDRALAVRAFAEAFSARSSTLRALERFDEALVSCDRALALQPNYVDALDNRGSTLREMKRFDESLASFDRAIALRPDHADLYNNRANTLREMYRLDEALASYDRALSLRPSLVEAINNRGMILQDMGRFDEALACCSQALALQPDLAEAHWIQGTVRLLTGDFPRGWPDYEWRWEKADTAAAKRNFPQPLWLGEHDLSGRTILLHCEQGLGDTIQFCRYVPLVAARGANVILEVQGPLQTLMSTLAGPSSIVARGSPLPDVDFQCPLLSLPLAFDTQLETIPSHTHYLRASSQASTDWSIRLGPKVRPRIGLVWSGNAIHKRDRERSLPLRSLLPLTDIDATFVSLQKDMRADDRAALKERGGIAMHSATSLIRRHSSHNWILSSRWIRALHTWPARSESRSGYC